MDAEVPARAVDGLPAADRVASFLHAGSDIRRLTVACSNLGFASGAVWGIVPARDARRLVPAGDHAAGRRDNEADHDQGSHAFGVSAGSRRDLS